MSTGYFLNLAFNGLIEGLIIGLAALAVTLVFGVARFPNAAAGDVMMTGAYAGYGGQILGGGLILVGALSAMAAAAAVSLAFYWLVFRKLAGRSAVYPLIASIGVAFLIRSLMTLFLGHDQRVYDLPLTRAMPFGPLRVVPTDLALGIIVLVRSEEHTSELQSR